MNLRHRPTSNPSPRYHSVHPRSSAFLVAQLRLTYNANSGGQLSKHYGARIWALPVVPAPAESSAEYAKTVNLTDQVARIERGCADGLEEEDACLRAAVARTLVPRPSTSVQSLSGLILLACRGPLWFDTTGQMHSVPGDNPVSPSPMGT